MRYILLFALLLSACSTSPEVHQKAARMTQGEWVVVATTPRQDGGLLGGTTHPTATLEQNGERVKMVTCDTSETLVVGDRVRFVDSPVARKDIVAFYECAILDAYLIK